jgi:hypothetical protein
MHLFQSSDEGKVPIVFSVQSLNNLYQSQSQSYVTSDGQSASLSWNKAPIWGYYYQTVAGLLMWGTLSDERTRLSFASHSQQ